MKRRVSLIILIILCSISLLCYGASEGVEASYEASTMKLLRHEGTVDIFDINGDPRFLLEGVRFLSGESMRTGPDGSASVGLDDTKIVSLDHDTYVQFIQEDNHMQLNLLEGEIFLDVSAKLDENASFDIQTTTMTVGIRGTIISASSKPDDNGKTRTTIAVYEGGGQVNFKDSNGTNRAVSLQPGQQISVETDTPASGSSSSNEEPAGVNPLVTDINGDNISPFAATEITSNENTYNRVVSGSPNGQLILLPGSGMEEGDELYPAGGKWYYSGEVTIVAQSAS